MQGLVGSRAQGTSSVLAMNLCLPQQPWWSQHWNPVRGAAGLNPGLSKQYFYNNNKKPKKGKNCIKGNFLAKGQEKPRPKPSTEARSWPAQLLLYYSAIQYSTVKYLQDASTDSALSVCSSENEEQVDSGPLFFFLILLFLSIQYVLFFLVYFLFLLLVVFLYSIFPLIFSFQFSFFFIFFFFSKYKLLLSKSYGSI